MRFVSKQFTKRRAGDFAKLSLDKDMMHKIVDDLQQNAGALSPNNHWHLVNKENEEDDTNIPDASIAEKYDDKFMSEYESAEKMLDVWIGCVGLKNISKESLESNKKFIEDVDSLGIYEQVIQSFDEYDYKERDLSTIAEANIIFQILNQNLSETKYVLEIGGGYGRIAEALMNIAEGIKYVMVDAVPGSILYSYEYLKYILPDKKVGFYYNNDAFDLDCYDIYIIPAWAFEKKNHYSYDLCINVSSMQEMSQSHVDYYLELFEKVTKEGGNIFIQNSHDYVFKGIWNYPKNWERILMNNTPASWTEYFPTEVFVKRNYDCTGWNQCISAIYNYTLEEKRRLNEKKTALQNEVWRLEYAEEELKKLREESQALKEENKKILETAYALEQECQELKVLKEAIKKKKLLSRFLRLS